MTVQDGSSALLDKAVVLEMARKHRSSVRSAWKIIIDNVIINYKRKWNPTSPFDLLLMFLYILEEQPTHIIEFSPWRGYSTAVLASAMRILERKHNFATFEHDCKLKPFIDARVKQHGLQEYVKVIWGDAVSKIPKHVNAHPDWNIGFAFVDCHNLKECSRRYIKKIFPKLSKNCLIFMHDISSDHKGRFFTNSPHPADGYIGVMEWVKKVKPEYALSHKEFGGQFQRSANLPRDNEFFRALKDILGHDILDHEKSAPVCFVCRNP